MQVRRHEIQDHHRAAIAAMSRKQLEALSHVAMHQPGALSMGLHEARALGRLAADLLAKMH